MAVPWLPLLLYPVCSQLEETFLMDEYTIAKHTSIGEYNNKISLATYCNYKLVSLGRL